MPIKQPEKRVMLRAVIPREDYQRIKERSKQIFMSEDVPSFIRIAVSEKLQKMDSEAAAVTTRMEEQLSLS